jgi:NDP-sugar pyrophosphorylase family protein|tara:strand:- start:157 stop:879 length:723 start_codon:yes stop_codon:yes gene_type:complete
MEWPNHAFANSLFPSLPPSKSIVEPSSEGYIPTLSNEEPVWHIFVEGKERNLKHQINVLESIRLELIDRKTLSDTITFDESKGPVMIEQGAIIEPSTHFIGPCFVGKNAVIRHGAYIRENAWICSSALVGHCTEVKHSILLPGAKAPHFNYVGDSILGKGVNLGAGVKLSNLRNDGTEIYLRIGESRVASGLRKFGAILGEGCQLGCNAVTNPGTVLGIDSIVWPNATVTGFHDKSSTHR